MKKFITTATLMGIIIMGTINANAGLMLSDLVGTDTPQPCTQNTDTKVDNGIIVSGLTGIIVSGLTGIIVSGLTEKPITVDCGVMMSD